MQKLMKAEICRKFIFRNGTLSQVDCLGNNGMLAIESSSVNLIISDLPYGCTQNQWDIVLPMDDLWAQYRRILKPNGVIALTAQGLFSARLMLAAPDLYKYSLVWHKNKATGHLNAKKQPLRAHEDILIFYKGQATYNPQMTEGHKPMNYAKSHPKNGGSSNYGVVQSHVTDPGKTWRYPTSVLPIPVVNNDDPDRVHPTQKPSGLADWLIRTYSNPGDVILDNCAGSGEFLLGVARTAEGREFIGFEADEKFAEIASRRIKKLEADNTFAGFDVKLDDSPEFSDKREPSGDKLGAIKF